MQLQVSLKTHRTKAGLIKAVTKIEPLSTGTMTGLAIQFALNVAFSEGEGARVKSPDISKVRHTFTRRSIYSIIMTIMFFLILLFVLCRLPLL